MEMSQIPEVVGKTIDTIASKLQVPAEKLLGAAVRGVHVEGIIGLVISTVGLLIVWVMVVWLCKFSKGKDWDGAEIGVPIGAVIVGGIISAMIITGMYDSAIKMFAPDYFLLKMILKF